MNAGFVQTDLDFMEMKTSNVNRIQNRMAVETRPNAIDSSWNMRSGRMSALDTKFMEKTVKNTK